MGILGRTWDAYDYYWECPVCKTCHYNSTVYCSDECYAADHTPEKVFARNLESQLRDAKEKERLAKQEQRILSFYKDHKPVYKPEGDSIKFWWKNNKRSTIANFLGRWQREKCFCFGRVHTGGTWAESLLRLEEMIHEGKVDQGYFIYDHENRLLSWEDFLHLAITSLMYDDEQSGVDETSPVLFGKMHHYKYASGPIDDLYPHKS